MVSVTYASLTALQADSRWRAVKKPGWASTVYHSENQSIVER
mgnify:CR=1 FL=1